jgi:hypothetical protein
MDLEAVQELGERGRLMVETFEILRHRNSDNLHLRLTGVFDEQAALLLIEELKLNRTGANKIFVHTAALEDVLPSGSDMFRSRLGSLQQRGAEIIFKGNRGAEIALKASGIRFIK